jgi:hypothetical protein
MIVQDADSGAITDGRIRYLMLRADVLMGLAKEWPAGDSQAFVRALERAAFTHSRDSFTSYRASGRFQGADFLRETVEVAAVLGWGKWRVHEVGANGRRITVKHSPFALGFGTASHPVCGAICGVLRAIVSVGYGQEAAVTEELCAAQSAGTECVFHLHLAPDVG